MRLGPSSKLKFLKSNYTIEKSKAFLKTIKFLNFRTQLCPSTAKSKILFKPNSNFIFTDDGRS